MATKRPERRMPNAADKPAKKTLMDNQDTTGKGDSSAHKKTRQMTFWVTEGQRARIKKYAQQHDMSVSRLVIEGLEMRMKRE